jgi:hypothetical protein
MHCHGHLLSSLASCCFCIISCRPVHGHSSGPGRKMSAYAFPLPQCPPRPFRPDEDLYLRPFHIHVGRVPARGTGLACWSRRGIPAYLVKRS